MKVSVKCYKGEKTEIIFNLEVEEEDKLKPSSNYSLIKRNFSFFLPKGVCFEEIHPDHLALVSLLVCHPFIGKRIEFPKGVSQQFMDANKIVTRYIVENLDESLSPWVPSTNSRPVLAFSGGADSTAALALLPSDTAAVFLDRTKPKSGTSLYDKEAPHVACDNLIEIGYDVMKIESDLEYVREPIGFPVDVANSAPAILLANHMEFDAIAFGTIMESAFGTGHNKYRNYPTGFHFSHLGGLFAAAGLPFLQVVSGVSEVGTAIINRDSFIGEIAHSCMRGKWMNPCKNCWKCFRKLLLDSVVNNEKIPDNELMELFKIKEAKRFLSTFPIKHENVLAYSTSKYIELFELDLEDDNNLMSLLAKRVRGDVLEVEWMAKYYPMMLETIPEKYKQGVKDKLEKYLLPMNEKEQELVLNWNMNSMLEDKYYQLLNKKFCKKIKGRF